MTTEQYLELANEVHKWGFSPNAVTAIRTLVAERDALADALMGLLDFGTSVNSNLVGDRYAAAHKALATLRL